jgi:molybdopterin/thiamine biosynthesis adenylyltransferase
MVDIANNPTGIDNGTVSATAPVAPTYVEPTVAQKWTVRDRRSGNTAQFDHQPTDSEIAALKRPFGYSAIKIVSEDPKTGVIEITPIDKSANFSAGPITVPIYSSSSWRRDTRSPISSRYKPDGYYSVDFLRQYYQSYHAFPADLNPTTNAKLMNAIRRLYNSGMTDIENNPEVPVTNPVVSSDEIAEIRAQRMAIATGTQQRIGRVLIDDIQPGSSTVPTNSVRSQTTQINYTGQGMKDPKILVVGAGGVGSNLTYLLAKLGYNKITLVDFDTTDEKFTRRFLFTDPNKTKTTDGKPKCEVIQGCIKDQLGIDIIVKNSKIEDVAKEIGAFDWVVCATDSVASRKMIESMYTARAKMFLHVGCNQGSVTVMKSMKGVIAEDPEPGDTIASSYDHEPDAATYIRSLNEVIEVLKGEKIYVMNEFWDAPEPVSTPGKSNNKQRSSSVFNLSLREKSDGWLEFTLGNYTFLGKVATIQLNSIWYNGQNRYVDPWITERTKKRVLVCYNTDINSAQCLDLDGNIFMTPHTYRTVVGMCTGEIPKPRNRYDKYSVMKYVTAVEASTCSANLDSPASGLFGNIRINTQEFVKNYTSSAPYVKTVVSNRVIAVYKPTMWQKIKMFFHIWKPPANTIPQATASTTSTSSAPVRSNTYL